MMWSLILILFLLGTPALELARSRKTRSKRDTAVFFAVWGLALAAVLADMAEWPGLRPLDWVRAVMQPVNALIS